MRMRDVKSGKAYVTKYGVGRVTKIYSSQEAKIRGCQRIWVKAIGDDWVGEISVKVSELFRAARGQEDY